MFGFTQTLGKLISLFLLPIMLVAFFLQ